MQTGEACFSPRWKAMLGYADDELPHLYQTWVSGLHPDDTPRVLQMLHEHSQYLQEPPPAGEYAYVMDGREALQHVRRLDPNIPVLVMSGYSDLEVAARRAGLGVSGFIQKPFLPHELAALVSRLALPRSAIAHR